MAQKCNLYRLTNVKTGEVIEGTTFFFESNYGFTAKNICDDARKNVLLLAQWKCEKIGRVDSPNKVERKEKIAIKNNMLEVLKVQI